ncbi:MAG: hypothetical protein FJ145_00525 [Deltaproteobacteria bacterium]|nr:hypothetical protein [Deltaproteobacteria bacterium]
MAAQIAIAVPGAERLPPAALLGPPPEAEPPQALWLAPDVRLCGKLLFDQQIWCWGCDVENPHGNLLLRYGFKRRRPPKGRDGCSQYSLALERGEIRLWGWGVLCRLGGRGIFLRRYRFFPQLRPPARLRAMVFLPNQVAPLCDPVSEPEQKAARARLAELCWWIAGYERWIARNCGSDYRKTALDKWHKPLGAYAHEMAQTWQVIAARCQPPTPGRRAGALLSMQRRTFG